MKVLFYSDMAFKNTLYLFARIKYHIFFLHIMNAIKSFFNEHELIVKLKIAVMLHIYACTSTCTHTHSPYTVLGVDLVKYIIFISYHLWMLSCCAGSTGFVIVSLLEVGILGQ